MAAEEGDRHGAANAYAAGWEERTGAEQCGILFCGKAADAIDISAGDSATGDRYTSRREELCCGELVCAAGGCGGGRCVASCPLPWKATGRVGDIGGWECAAADPDQQLGFQLAE